MKGFGEFGLIFT